MHVRYSLLASQATTALFVLLWGSAAIFTRWGLDNASPMALLVFRFLVALVALPHSSTKRAVVACEASRE